MKFYFKKKGKVFFRKSSLSPFPARTCIAKARLVWFSVFYTGVGVGGGGEPIGCGAISGIALIWKKAIVISRTPIHIMSRPMMTIVKAAPMSSSRPAVENKPT